MSSHGNLDNDHHEWKYDSCNYYNHIDYDTIIRRFGNDYSAAFDYVQGLQVPKETKACSKWQYDDSIYSSTIVTEVGKITVKHLV